MAFFSKLTIRKNKYQTLDNGVSCVVGDAALVALVARHENVALIAPNDTPAVLHLPVGRPVEGAVADHRYSVVMPINRTSRIVVHSLFVVLKGRLTGINDHRDGAHVGDGLLQRALRALWHVTIASKGGANVLDSEGAGPLVAGVRVRLLSVYTSVGNDVLKGGIGPAAAAALVGIRAIDQVLLGERHQLAGTTRVLALHCGHCREGPAVKRRKNQKLLVHTNEVSIFLNCTYQPPHGPDVC